MQEIPRSQDRIQRRQVTTVHRGPVYGPAPEWKELTRDQYLALLETARRMRKVPAYLAMRAVVSTGIQLQEFLALTVEAVRAGEIVTAERTVRLPDSLREELLDYAERNGVSGGAIFAGRTGRVSLTTIRDQIRTVSRAAGLEDDAACTRALQKLYETTRAGLVAKAAERLMLEQLDEEQRVHGWKD